jgi:hypothetical protein
VKKDSKPYQKIVLRKIIECPDQIEEES